MTISPATGVSSVGISRIVSARPSADLGPPVLPAHPGRSPRPGLTLPGPGVSWVNVGMNVG